MKISISFDYDSPAGYRESFHMRDADPAADQKGTEALLKVLDYHGVTATFAIVGEVGLMGAPPAHCQEQIREIRAAGHEIASHSMHHKFIPPMDRAEFLADARDSRHTLERCIGEPVVGFVPPFNRPMHFPRRRAPSFSEMFGMHGRGRGRQSIPSMLSILHDAGYEWSRISFADKVLLALEATHLSAVHAPEQPFVEGGVVAIPCHAIGFGPTARRLARLMLESDHVLAIGAHPNQALTDNDESVSKLDGFLSALRPLREERLVSFQTMRATAMTLRPLEEMPK